MPAIIFIIFCLSIGAVWGNAWLGLAIGCGIVFLANVIEPRP